MQRFASVLLLDARGRILLQERDEHPLIDPEKWGLPGGHVEPGEDVLAAAYRELAEETGVHLPPGDDGLRPFGVFDVDHHGDGRTHEVHVFAAAVDLGDGDVECHEGRQMVFVDPTAIPGLDLGAGARAILPRFLGSRLHRDLSRELPPGRLR
ncbi:NUDIX domain-containing protein [Nocardioides ferulae]|uniref:NUDIX domain-containing protein n=1 Tax=Nocardioides ferulae TaxID=2340821 RepID=UPI000EB4CBBD|nr:NUDIX hydrolase [Nocardioides ferulae]